MTKTDYSDFAGQWFVFIGQNATTGTPNQLTGRMSTYGRYYGSFKTRKDAVEFAENHDDGMAQTISVAGTARTLRRYSLGCPLFNYFQDLHTIDCLEGDQY